MSCTRQLLRVAASHAAIPGCGPCKAIAPVYASLASSHPNALFLKVDVDKVSTVARAQNVTAMPTFSFIKSSRTLEQLRGADPNKLRSLVQKYDDGKAPAGGFPGGGRTIGGATPASTTPPGAGNPLHGVKMENLLPLVVVALYLAYVLWP